MLSTRNLKAGDVLDGRYRLERRVGGGGMGDVWEGTDTILWRTVAVKILLADLVDDRGFRERFRREAQAIAVMKGPGVVEVYDYGEIDHGDAQIAYLIMEYIDGKPLSRLLGLWGKLPPEDSLRIVGGVAEALRAAHSAGIVHRDIKPGNILVRDDGSVVLVDFGIARAGHNLTLTTTGVVLGTVTYMSPEQAAGENLTASSDLYSLGVVAHQCLSGSPPFQADTPLGVLSAHLRNDPPALPPDVPPDVVGIVLRALQKEPSARWPDAAALAEACRRARAAILQADRSAVPPPPPPPLTRVRSDPFTGSEPSAPSVSREGGDAVTPPIGALPPERQVHRRRLWAVLAGSVAVIAAIAMIAASSPWNDRNVPGTLPTGETAEDGEEVRGRVGDDQAPANNAEDAPWQPDAPTSPEESSASERGGSDQDETSPPADNGKPSEGATTSISPTPSPTQSAVQTVAVPEVAGQTESAARRHVEESDLSPSVVYSGEGDHQCGVTRQAPSAGTQVEPKSTVELTVQKAADADSCKNESDAPTSETPPQQ